MWFFLPVDHYCLSARCLLIIVQAAAALLSICLWKGAALWLVGW